MLFLFLSMFLALLIIFLNHPISMGLLILTQTILLCNFMGFFSLNFWFSYILILIMIGGLLILFIYMTSIASNEIFNINLKNLFLMPLFLMLSFFLFKSLNLENFNSNLLSFMMWEKKFFYFSMSKFYNYPFFNLIILTIIYLLISMIAVIKITSNKKSPLRQLY
uniref:NADH-ubiquinone oxidoreductase chain 6 n=1 Tax=Cucujoidea sp. 1 KM-2017 TaxID=2219345 RepID=A0A346RJF1_9CUCU|nr:NADH dehydrogenase subunit 6 [Cucujoidea sp. 1 KM-2017]